MKRKSRVKSKATPKIVARAIAAFIPGDISEEGCGGTRESAVGSEIGAVDAVELLLDVGVEGGVELLLGVGVDIGRER